MFNKTTYPYKYYRKIKTQTSIKASREIILEMARFCREYYNLKETQNLQALGIFPTYDKRGWYIICCHPLRAMATREERISFDHFDLAKQVTRVWRNRIAK